MSGSSAGQSCRSTPSTERLLCALGDRGEKHQGRTAAIRFRCEIGRFAPLKRPLQTLSRMHPGIMCKSAAGFWPMLRLRCTSRDGRNGHRVVLGRHHCGQGTLNRQSNWISQRPAIAGWCFSGSVTTAMSGLLAEMAAFDVFENKSIALKLRRQEEAVRAVSKQQLF